MLSPDVDRMNVTLETDRSPRRDLCCRNEPADIAVAMSPQTSDSVDRILKDSSGDVAKLMDMGITEFAIITYARRVRPGQSSERSLDALLEGRRSLTKPQARFGAQCTPAFSHRLRRSLSRGSTRNVRGQYASEPHLAPSHAVPDSDRPSICSCTPLKHRGIHE
jgi:hypothetical protein